MNKLYFEAWQEMTTKNKSVEAKNQSLKIEIDALERELKLINSKIKLAQNERNKINQITVWGV